MKELQPINQNVGGDVSGGSNDSITDFTVATPSAGGDVLDLSDLLAGQSVNPSNLGGYLQLTDITHNGDGTTTVQLSVDLNGGGDSYAPLASITMSGVELLVDPADILQRLLDNHELKLE